MFYICLWNTINMTNSWNSFHDFQVLSIPVEAKFLLHNSSTCSSNILVYYFCEGYFSAYEIVDCLYGATNTLKQKFQKCINFLFDVIEEIRCPKLRKRKRKYSPFLLISCILFATDENEPLHWINSRVICFQVQLICLLMM